MIRYAMKELENWKKRKDRKPLIIRGARQVGKTWLMREFGRTRFKKVAYINFDNNERMISLFQGDLDINRLVTALQIEAGITITASDTLIIFDEVQEVPRALTSLKYFNENAPEYAILAAGSMLGVALHPGTSFPVGKVDFLKLYPMSFLEFLEATENSNLADLLRSRDFSLITAFKGKYTDLLKQYYYVGGMPEAVASFAGQKDYREVRRIQNRLLEAYEQDFSKHAPNETVPRIRMLWNSVPAQLAKENRKFIYGLIRQGARAKEFELAMQWLLDCGLIHKVCRVTKPDMPLMAYQEQSVFKLYMVDVGLLAAKSGLDLKSLLEGNRVFEEFKGALTEQYVQQQLLAEGGIEVFYWTAERATAEVDFVFQLDSDVVPVEVKAEENLKAKSLKFYCEKYRPRHAVRASMSDYRKEQWLTNVPLYAVGVLKDLLA
ncbi:MAG: ATP-binding protein [Bacillota bacterium]